MARMTRSDVPVSLEVRVPVGADGHPFPYGCSGREPSSVKCLKRPSKSVVVSLHGGVTLAVDGLG